MSQHDNIDRAKEINALYQERGFMPDHFARWIADYEAEIRADEREKAAQRVKDLLFGPPYVIGEGRTIDVSAIVAAAGDWPVDYIKQEVEALRAVLREAVSKYSDGGEQE